MGDIVLKYRGAEYRLPASQFFEVGDQIEDVALLFEVIGWQKSPHTRKMSRCIHIMLTAAGCKTTKEEVLHELMLSVTKGDGNVRQMLDALVYAMMDGAPDGNGDASGEPQPAS